MFRASSSAFKSANSIKASFLSPRFKNQTSIRLVHNVPRLVGQESLESTGVPGLFSPEAFGIAWTQYQKFLLDKLTSLTVDTDHETRRPFTIVLNTATNAHEAHVFNYASQAHNNHLFFETLSFSETNTTSPNVPLLKRIEVSFGNMDELKSQFLETANAFSGNGWVFLVEGADKSLYIMSCHNAGSPYTSGRAQVVDLNGPTNDDVLNTIDQLQQTIYVNEKNHNIVLLALNIWEHAYMYDFSVAGKSEYVEKWWDRIDWNIVSSRLFKFE